MNDNPYILEAKEISKSFPGVQALNNVSLFIRPGEVHALMGENGAGKSTLMKVLMGLYKPDSGEIIFGGSKVEIKNPFEALKMGISMIHQELSPLPEMTVAENIFLGREKMHGKLPVLNKKQQEDETNVLLKKFNISKSVDAKMKMKQLSVALIQMIEIIKAVSYNSKLIIMDEPTSSLSEGEVRELFKTIHNLQNNGVAIIYISHRMEEVFELAERVTVLRDGQFIGCEKMSDLTNNKLISMMVGRELTNIFPKYTVPIGEKEFEVKSFTRKGVFEDISFSVKKGEILGIAGLVGAGRSEIMRAIVGFDKHDSGEIFVENKKVKIHSPLDAINNGISLVSEDRKELGLILCRSIKENIALPSIRKFVKTGVINKRQELKECQSIADRLTVKMSRIQQNVEDLSGGNQQKVVLSKWLLTKPKVLILDEPTRGIDVGAKSEIHKMMCDLAKSGMAIIMISSEMPEVLGMSDRIIIIGGGRIKGEINRQDATQEEILKIALGGM